MMIQRTNEGGFALVTALWAALILALIVSFVVRAGRTDGRVAHTAIRQAELRAVARGALTMMELRLLSPLGTLAPSLDGTPIQITCAEHQVQVTTQDQAGLIDLNFASAETLRRLFEAARLNSLDAQTLTDRVIDWRERGNDKRLNGAKAPDYAAAGYTYGPREAPFESVSELKLVMGISPTIFDRVSPALTVYSQKAVIEPENAPELVLETLPGQTPDSAAMRVGARRSELESANGRSLSHTSLVGKPLKIAAMVVDSTGVAFMAISVIRVTGYSSNPFWVYRHTDSSAP